MHAESFAHQRHLLGIYPKRFSVRCTHMLKEMQNPTAFISRVRASWSRSASSLEKNFTSPFFWRHTTETMSWQSFSGFTAVNCLYPCISRNGDACEHFGTLAPLGKKLISIRSIWPMPRDGAAIRRNLVSPMPTPIRETSRATNAAPSPSTIPGTSSSLRSRFMTPMAT